MNLKEHHAFFIFDVSRKLAHPCFKAAPILAMLAVLVPADGNLEANQGMRVGIQDIAIGTC